MSADHAPTYRAAHRILERWFGDQYLDLDLDQRHRSLLIVDLIALAQSEQRTLEDAAAALADRLQPTTLASYAHTLARGLL
jgi:hypothetical protein